MSALILKSANHLYKLFKVYLSLAIIGAIGVVVIELFLAKPIVLLFIFFSLSMFCIGAMLWVQVHKLSFERRSKELFEKLQSKPPKLPESLMLIILPRNAVGPILGDLTEDYHRLMNRHGYRSAATWYTIESMKIIFHATALHLGLNIWKSFARFKNKESS